MAGFEEIAQHHTIKVNGLRIHYLRAGSGDPLVLLHGFPETSYAWRKVLPALSERFTVIAPDLRGCGDSDRPDRGYDKQTVASDIHQLIKTLQLGPVRLVGHDVGMMVAYAYAAEYRDDVTQLVLMEAALPGLGLEAMYNSDQEPRMWHLGLFEAPNELAEALISGRERVFVDHFMRQQSYNPAALDEGLEEYARRLSAPGALHAGIEYFRAHHTDAEHNKKQAQSKLKMPVLTVGGRASFGERLFAQVQPLAERVESVMIEECGHYLAEERPQELVSALMKFFTIR